MAKSSSTSESPLCLLSNYLDRVCSTEFVLNEIPDTQQRNLRNLFLDSGWAIHYEHLLSKNCEIDHMEWCNRWFKHLKIIRSMFERTLKTKPEAVEYILADPNLSIYFFHD